MAIQISSDVSSNVADHSSWTPQGSRQIPEDRNLLTLTTVYMSTPSAMATITLQTHSSTPSIAPKWVETWQLPGYEAWKTHPGCRKIALANLAIALLCQSNFQKLATVINQSYLVPCHQCHFKNQQILLEAASCQYWDSLRTTLNTISSSGSLSVQWLKIKWPISSVVVSATKSVTAIGWNSGMHWQHCKHELECGCKTERQQALVNIVIKTPGGGPKKQIWFAFRQNMTESYISKM